MLILILPARKPGNRVAHQLGHYTGLTSREANAIRSIRHDNIARYVDEGTTPEGESYLVTEYVDGSTLEEYLRGGTFTISEAISIGRQLISALESFHPQPGLLADLRAKAANGDYDAAVALEDPNVVGLVHRDIKPANVILRDDGVVKLIDFGIASPVGNTMNTMHRTPGYLPPGLELQIASGHWEPWIDVFQIGVLLYELTTGRLPYGDSSAPEPSEYFSPKNHPKAWRVLLKQACSLAPTSRPADATALRELLNSVAEVLGVGPDDPGSLDVADSSLSVFVGWSPRRQPTVPQLGANDLRDLLCEIVVAEAPVLRRRLYRLISTATGELLADVRPVVDEALDGLVLDGRLQQVEEIGLPDPDTTITVAAVPRSLARQLGKRTVWEVCRLEREAILSVLSGEPDEAQLAISLGLSPRSWESPFLAEWLEPSLQDAAP